MPPHQIQAERLDQSFRVTDQAIIRWPASDPYSRSGSKPSFAGTRPLASFVALWWISTTVVDGTENAAFVSASPTAVATPRPTWSTWTQ